MIRNTGKEKGNSSDCELNVVQRHRNKKIMTVVLKPNDLSSYASRSDVSGVVKQFLKNEVVKERSVYSTDHYRFQG
jgi:hypothetical protein